MNVTLSVFFSGTGHSIADTGTLASLLNNHVETPAEQKTMAFDGCGVTHGFRGLIFGTGLDEQCQDVVEQIEVEIKKGNTVTLNVYGHSRGAIAALMLAKQLSKVDVDILGIKNTDSFAYVLRFMRRIHKLFIRIVIWIPRIKRGT